MPAEDPPSAAALRSAFEAQYPKTDATADALALERLAAKLGIDLVPNASMDVSSPEASPGADAEPKVRWVKVGGERSGPSAEAQRTSQPIRASASQYVADQLKNSEERIGAPARVLEGYLEEHENIMEAIEAVLVGDADVRWETDVKKTGGGPVPSLMGLMQLQRLLVARALIQARRGEADGALQTVEAAWALNEILSARPELICQLIVVAAAKLHVGVLRKLDVPAWGWPDRLRNGELFSAFLAAFQNEFWVVSETRDLSGEGGAYGRVLRQVAEELGEEDACSWTPPKLQETWERAVRDHVSDNDDVEIVSIAVPNLMGAFERWRRFLIDAELTALVLDARAERAASRRREWPPQLRSMGSGVCPKESWSYRPSGKTATFAFEGKVVEEHSVPFRLPLRFTAGLPAAPIRRTPAAGPRWDISETPRPKPGS